MSWRVLLLTAYASVVDGCTHLSILVAPTGLSVSYKRRRILRWEGMYWGSRRSAEVGVDTIKTYCIDV